MNYDQLLSVFSLILTISRIYDNAYTFLYSILLWTSSTKTNKTNIYMWKIALL